MAPPRTFALVFGAIFVLLMIYALLPAQNHKSPEWIQPKSIQRNAFVTLAITDESVTGVLVLAHTLREVRAQYPLVVLVAEDVTEPYKKVLSHPYLNTKVIPISKIMVPITTKIEVPAWREALSKLRAWELTQYTKLIYLDADQLVLKNIDSWFEFPDLTGAVNQDLTCVTQPIPDRSQGGISTAVLIFQPNKTVFTDLLKVLKNGNDWPNADQDVIDHYYNRNSALISQEEATLARCCIAPWFDREKLKIVHFSSFALNYEDVIFPRIFLAAELIDVPHNKNWEGMTNCDNDFYVTWKRGYHQVMEIVNKEEIIETIQEENHHYAPIMIILLAILVIGSYSYEKFVTRDDVVLHH